MEITFIWSGHDLAGAQKEEIQANISREIDDNFHELLHPPITVHLFHNFVLSVITGIVVNCDKNQVIKITCNLADRNSTTYELI